MFLMMFMNAGGQPIASRRWNIAQNGAELYAFLISTNRMYNCILDTIAVLMIEMIDEISSWHPCFGRLPACASQISRFRSVYWERRCVRIAENILYRLFSRAI